MKLHNERRNIVYCRVGVDIERHGKLIGELSHSGLAVTPVPDVAGCLVQLMNEAGLTIEYHYLTINHTKVYISSSFWVICRLVHPPRSSA
jgi:hypothetical protein